MTTAPRDDYGRPATETADDDARLADIVRSAGDAIVGGTLDGVVTTWNAAAENLYGYRADDIIGRHAETLYPAECRAGEAALLRRLARGERLDQYVAERVRRDGSTVLVRLSASPVTDRTGRIVGVAAISRGAKPGPPGPASDAAQAGRTRGVLPSHTSHELRTPLQAVIGFTGTLLLRLPGPLNDEQERQLTLVQDSARQLLSLINELSRPGDR